VTSPPSSPSPMPSPNPDNNNETNNKKPITRENETIISSKPPISPINGNQTAAATNTSHLNNELTVDTSQNRQYLETQNTNLLQPSPLSTKSTASTVNTQSNNYQAQQRVLSASDAANSSSFVRGVSFIYFQWTIYNLDVPFNFSFLILEFSKLNN
jgi:hypothetical protein